MSAAGEIALPGTPETGVVTPDGTRLYVALSDAGKVAVIDVQARSVRRDQSTAWARSPGVRTWPGSGQLLPLTFFISLKRRALAPLAWLTRLAAPARRASRRPGRFAARSPLVSLKRRARSR